MTRQTLRELASPLVILALAFPLGAAGAPSFAPEGEVVPCPQGGIGSLADHVGAPRPTPAASAARWTATPPDPVRRPAPSSAEGGALQRFAARAARARTRPTLALPASGARLLGLRAHAANAPPESY